MITVDEPVGRRVRRRTWFVAAGAVAAAALSGVWVATAPDAVVSPGATIGMPQEVGESGYVGYYPLSGRDLIIESIEPVTLNGLDVALWMCDPAPGQDPIGSATSEHLAEFCRLVEPFDPGTTMAGRLPGSHVVEPYLLVEVKPTADGPQGLCGLDIRYRVADGWRTGQQQDGGSYRVVVNESVDFGCPTTSCCLPAKPVMSG